MLIYAVYIISSDGKTIISENFQKHSSISDKRILGGMFTALEGTENDNSEMKSYEIEGLSYHVRMFSFGYKIVLVTQVPRPPEDMIQTLGLRFMKEYGEKLEDGTLKNINDFKETIREIIAPDFIDNSQSIKPTKTLNTGEIFSLPHHLQQTALAMITLQDGLLEDIAKEAGESIESTNTHLTDLQNMGFIGLRKIENKTLYYCSI